MFNKYTMEGSISRPVSSGVNSQNLGISDPVTDEVTVGLKWGWLWKDTFTRLNHQTHTVLIN